MASEPEAAAGPATLRVGCPMWAHRPWVGRWYPSGTRPGTELSVYARLCNAVEGNTTFYGVPTAATVQRWVEQAPRDFRFVFKLPRVVTHDRLLHDVAEPMRGFLNAIEPLGERVGAVTIQLPPTFGPGGLDVLAAFVRRLPADRAWAIELRHPSFFDRSDAHLAVDALLAPKQIGRVVLDTRPLHAVPARSAAAIEEMRNKPQLPIVLDAVGPRPILRVIGEDSAAGSLNGLLAWVPQLVAWLGAGREPYVFVHQPENLDSPDLARRLHAAVRTQAPGLTPLPEPLAVVDDGPAQTAMF